MKGLKTAIMRGSSNSEMRKSSRRKNQADNEEVGPMAKHHMIYHPEEIPHYWAKQESQHVSAISRQVTEAVLIEETASVMDITMNSKGEIFGNRLPRVVVDRE